MDFAVNSSESTVMGVGEQGRFGLCGGEARISGLRSIIIRRYALIGPPENSRHKPAACWLAVFLHLRVDSLTAFT